MTRALGSPFGVSGAATIHAGMGREFPRTFLRVEGFADSVDLSHRAAAWRCSPNSAPSMR